MDSTAAAQSATTVRTRPQTKAERLAFIARLVEGRDAIIRAELAAARQAEAGQA
jgi:hypothetical protein